MMMRWMWLGYDDDETKFNSNQVVSDGGFHAALQGAPLGPIPLNYAVEPLYAFVLLAYSLPHRLLVLHELLLVLPLDLFQPLPVLQLKLGELIVGLADLVQGLPQLLILLLRPLQEVDEGLYFVGLVLSGGSHPLIGLLVLFDLGLECLDLEAHLLVLLPLLVRLLLVLLDYLQEVIDLLLRLVYVLILLPRQLLDSSLPLPRLPLQHLRPAARLLRLPLQLLQTDCEVFLILEEFGDELDVVLHHYRQLLLLFLQGVLQL